MGQGTVLSTLFVLFFISFVWFFSYNRLFVLSFTVFVCFVILPSLNLIYASPCFSKLILDSFSWSSYVELSSLLYFSPTPVDVWELVEKKFSYTVRNFFGIFLISMMAWSDRYLSLCAKWISLPPINTYSLKVNFLPIYKKMYLLSLIYLFINK